MQNPKRNARPVKVHLKDKTKQAHLQANIPIVFTATTYFWLIRLKFPEQVTGAPQELRTVFYANNWFYQSWETTGAPHTAQLLDIAFRTGPSPLAFVRRHGVSCLKRLLKTPSIAYVDKLHAPSFFSVETQQLQRHSM